MGQNITFNTFSSMHHTIFSNKSTHFNLSYEKEVSLPIDYNFNSQRIVEALSFKGQFDDWINKN